MRGGPCPCQIGLYVRRGQRGKVPIPLRSHPLNVRAAAWVRARREPGGGADDPGDSPRGMLDLRNLPRRHRAAVVAVLLLVALTLLHARDPRGVWWLSARLTVAILGVALAGAVAAGPGRRRGDPLLGGARDARRPLRLVEGERVRARAAGVQLVSRLAGRIAHELNNPLAVARANIEFLAGRDLANRDPELREVVAETRASVERIALVAAELKPLAAMVPGDAARCDLSTILHEVLSGLGDPIRQRLRVRASPGLEALVDGALLAHCVRHLVLGAASLADGSALTVGAARRAEGPAIEVVAGGRSLSPGDDGSPRGGPAFAGGVHCGQAGLHFAFAEELARALGGVLETARTSEGSPRLSVVLPAQVRARP